MDGANSHGTIPLISWDNICRSKCESRLGIRKVLDVNVAFLSQLGWKIISDQIVYGQRSFGINT